VEVTHPIASMPDLCDERWKTGPPRRRVVTLEEDSGCKNQKQGPHRGRVMASVEMETGGNGGTQKSVCGCEPGKTVKGEESEIITVRRRRVCADRRFVSPREKRKGGEGRKNAQTIASERVKREGSLSV